jgi:hypothetical protein
MCMSNRSLITFGARFLVLSLIFGVFGIFNTGSTLAAKNRGEETLTTSAQGANSQLSGQLIASGAVTVNGNKAITGTTVFTNSNIAVDCAKGNSAIIDLGKLGRVELVAGTKLMLRFSDGLISGDLQDGKAVISTPADVKVDVGTPNGPVTATCVQTTQECVTPVAVQGFTQCVPVVAAAPAPVPIPISRGLSGRAIAAIAGAGAAGVAAAAAIASDDDNDVVVTVASPTTP